MILTDAQLEEIEKLYEAVYPRDKRAEIDLRNKITCDLLDTIKALKEEIGKR